MSDSSPLFLILLLQDEQDPELFNTPNTFLDEWVELVSPPFAALLRCVRLNLHRNTVPQLWPKSLYALQKLVISFTIPNVLGNPSLGHHCQIS